LYIIVFIKNGKITIGMYNHMVLHIYSRWLSILSVCCVLHQTAKTCKNNMQSDFCYIDITLEECNVQYVNIKMIRVTLSC